MYINLITFQIVEICLVLLNIVHYIKVKIQSSTLFKGASEVKIKLDLNLQFTNKYFVNQQLSFTIFKPN
jgi:hypothetical protein